MNKDNFSKTCTIASIYSRNYGGFLQAWALQQFLGKSNFILNFVPSYYYSVGDKARRKWPFFWRFIALWRYLRRQKPFKEINMLRLSRKYTRLEDVKKKSPEADVYIVGSGQVWNERWHESVREIPFLEFGASDIKRITYAPSMGTKEWSQTFTQQVLPHLKTFHAISVREESSAVFLNKIGLKDVVVTCDPSVLLTADFYRSHFQLEQTKSSKHIFVYKLREDIPLPIQSLLHEKKVAIVDLKKERTLVSIAQWLSNIDTADYVITDSFHCAVFSILFHKSFIVLPNHKEKEQNERLITLLEKTKLYYRLLTGNENQKEIEEILCSPIDWDQIDRILEEWRTYSANWLRSALSDD